MVQLYRIDMDLFFIIISVVTLLSIWLTIEFMYSKVDVIQPLKQCDVIYLFIYLFREAINLQIKK